MRICGLGLTLLNLGWSELRVWDGVGIFWKMKEGRKKLGCFRMMWKEGAFMMFPLISFLFVF